MNAGQNKSIGEAVSELAALGLETATASRRPTDHGLVMLPSAPDHVITSEMVEDALLDE
ncbi:Uncharacterised protein [Tsukamurella paurometabola]|uniref:Uncharacterized protein n=1 Tax=Tsukamurella paurometabola TaxID=2061 RepID=A0A3P8JXS3_TSUPA|nr:Uncharacterised protein [Tsukamurella paurometabola]